MERFCFGFYFHITNFFLLLKKTHLQYRKILRPFVIEYSILLKEWKKNVASVHGRNWVFHSKMCTLASMTTNTIKGKHNYCADLTRSRSALHEFLFTCIRSIWAICSKSIPTPLNSTSVEKITQNHPIQRRVMRK